MFPNEIRSIPLDEIRVTADSGSGDTAPRQVEWYAAVFDTPAVIGGMWREKWSRRAFSKSLNDGADVRGLLNHDSNFVLGRNKSGTLSLKVDLTGLHATVTPPDTQWARDLLVSIERGDISGGSIGFRVIKDAWTTDTDGMMLRTVQEAALLDVSVVTYPAFDATEGSVALRSAFAGLIDLDDLALPVARARAGMPLTPDERASFLANLDRLRSSVPEPPIPDTAEEPSDASVPDAPDTLAPPANDGHSVRLTLLRRRLHLSVIKGGQL